MQKTAYEMRISDWSSDVCSSDLGEGLSHFTTQRKSPAVRGFFFTISGNGLLRHHPHHLQALVRIAPLVVVPAHQLDEGGVERDAGFGVAERGAGVAAEMGGDDLVLGVAEIGQAHV